nr:galactosylceramide sulfotransferase-like [Dermacentor andersoni]
MPTTERLDCVWVRRRCRSCVVGRQDGPAARARRWAAPPARGAAAAAAAAGRGGVADPLVGRRRRTKTRLSLEQLASGNRSLSARLARKRTRSKLGFNQMSFDLGLEPAQFANATAVRRFVERLDATFDLVMVAERINESLVLLRDLLCGDVDDVVVFRHNARQTSYRRPPSGRLAAQLRELNAADVQLYEHFARRFEQRVRRFGPRRMARELRLLEQRTRHWHERCVRDTRPADDDARGFWVSAKVLTFRPKNDSSLECARMTLPELVFTERLRKKQSGNATRSH